MSTEIPEVPESKHANRKYATKGRGRIISPDDGRLISGEEREAALVEKHEQDLLDARNRNLRRHRSKYSEAVKVGKALTASGLNDMLSDLDKLNAIEKMLVSKITNEAVIVASESCYEFLNDEQQRLQKFRMANLKDLFSVEKSLNELARRVKDIESSTIGAVINMNDDTMKALEDARQTLTNMGIDMEIIDQE